MRTMLVSRDAIRVPSVVFERTTHLYSNRFYTAGLSVSPRRPEDCGNNDTDVRGARGGPMRGLISQDLGDGRGRLHGPARIHHDEREGGDRQGGRKPAQEAEGRQGGLRG